MLYDAFNGDADGICALIQLRLAAPADSVLVTGVKRDIGLLARVPARAGDAVTVLDVAVARNAEALDALLARGVRVRWFDHHDPGRVPEHPGFEAHIDTDAEVCTSLLVDRHLGGRHRAWAVAAAFGDGLPESARRAAGPLGLTPGRLDQLRELGECVNYNAYGDSLEDLYFHPAELYRRLYACGEPYAFVEEAPEFRTLKEGCAADLARARALRPAEARASGAVYVLPDAAWARRVSGVYANALAQGHPARAHAVLTPSTRGHYSVSVRAPLAARSGADALCRRFEGGGGRRAAAGINALPEARVGDFLQAFFEAYAG